MGFRPYDPNSGGGSGDGMPIAPDDGKIYAAEGANWVNTITTATSNLYTWSDDTSATDPNPQKVKIDNADESLSTNIYISETTLNGGSIEAIGSKAAIGDLIRLQQYGVTGNFITYTVRDNPTDNGGWWTVPVTVLENSGGFVADVSISMDFWATSNRAGTILIERLLDGTSTALAQEPTGRGIANAIQIEFGAASGGALEAYALSADGAMTINETGLYRIKVAMHVGRTGSSGTSELLFRVLVNGVQAGRSVAFKITNANDESYFENDNWVNIVAGTVITFEIMRDNLGDDSGGLFAVIPDDEGAGTWNEAPTAALRLERWVSS